MNWPSWDGRLMEAHSPRLRLSILAVVVISLFGALFARMWYLQVMVANRYQLQATADRVRTVQIEAPRGLIYDDKGRRAGRATAPRSWSRSTPSAFDKLTPKDDQADLMLRVATELTNSGVPTKVEGIQHDLVDKQSTSCSRSRSPSTCPTTSSSTSPSGPPSTRRWRCERESVRTYPNGSLAANVLGYVGRISDTELKAKQGGITPTRKVAKPYQPDSEIGKTGVEAAYEDYLRGTPGIEKIEVDAANNPVRVLSETQPDPRRRPRADPRHRRPGARPRRPWPSSSPSSRARPRVGTHQTMKAPGRLGGGHRPQHRWRAWPWPPTRPTTRPTSSTASRPTSTRS